MTTPDFDFGSVPLSCWDCRAIRDALANAARSAENLKELQESNHGETVATIESYLGTLAAIEGSHAMIAGSTQDIINAYGLLSRRFSCEGNDPQTGKCRISRAILRNPYQ